MLIKEMRLPFGLYGRERDEDDVVREGVRERGHGQLHLNMKGLLSVLVDRRGDGTMDDTSLRCLLCCLCRERRVTVQYK